MVSAASRSGATSARSNSTQGPVAGTNQNKSAFKTVGHKVVKALKEHHEKTNAAFEAMYGLKGRS